VARNLPVSQLSLYGRGLAKRRKDDAAGADADISDAVALDARVEDEFVRYGMLSASVT
jgi:hypothetical protein